MARPVAFVVMLLAMLATGLLGVQSAGAAPGTFDVAVTMDGIDAAEASAGDPIRLFPDKSVDVVLTMTNNRAEALSLRQVQFNGRVIGLNFFSYATAVDATIDPGQTQTLKYRIDLTGLRGQATGLIGAQVVLIDTSGKTVTTIETVTDVDGSLMSVYGLFGVALVVLTALAVIDAAIGLARHRLSANRWQRGVRLLLPGVGIGLVVAFSASVARLWVPSTGLWLVMAGLTAAVFFALGYFSPTPDDDDDDDEDDELLDDETQDIRFNEPRR